MNVKLWRAICLERARRKAVSQAIKRDVDPWSVSGDRKFLSKRWTLIRRFVGVLNRSLKLRTGLRSAKGRRLVVPEDGGRYQEILGALFANGLRTKDVAVIFGARKKTVWNMGQIRMLVCLCRIFLTSSRRVRRFFDIIAIYYVARSEIEHWHRAHFVCIGDTSPFLIGFCAGAGAAGQPVIAWQIDHMDWKPFPMRPAISVPMNWAGLALAFGPAADRELQKGKVFWQPSPKVVPVRSPAMAGRAVGLLLAWPYEEFVYETLLRVRASVCGEIVIRPHPRTDPSSARFPDGMRVSDTDLALEDFVKGVDWVICGNTSAALKVLCVGKAVLQIGGLDRATFDKHEYIAHGIIHGVKEIEDFSFGELREFYASGRYAESLASLLAPGSEERTRGLHEFVEAIRG